MCVIQNIFEAEVLGTSSSLFKQLSLEVRDLLGNAADVAKKWEVDELCDYEGDQMLVFSLLAGGDLTPNVVVHCEVENVVISTLTEDACQRLAVAQSVAVAMPLLRSLLVRLETEAVG